MSEIRGQIYIDNWESVKTLIRYINDGAVAVFSNMGQPRGSGMLAYRKNNDFYVQALERRPRSDYEDFIPPEKEKKVSCKELMEVFYDKEKNKRHVAQVDYHISGSWHDAVYNLVRRGTKPLKSDSAEVEVRTEKEEEQLRDIDVVLTYMEKNMDAIIKHGGFDKREVLDNLKKYRAWIKKSGVVPVQFIHEQWITFDAGRLLRYAEEMAKAPVGQNLSEHIPYVALCLRLLDKYVPPATKITKNLLDPDEFGREAEVPL